MPSRRSIPKVLLWGGQSMARITAEMLLESGAGRLAIIFDETLEKPSFLTEAFFTNDPEILRTKLAGVTHFVTCIGGEHGYARAKTSVALEALGLKPLGLAHANSFSEPTATLGKGCQLMPFAVVHKFSRVGDYAILNTHCAIDHECVLGKGVHVMGSAAIAGRVTIGDYATIGTNATILPNLTIGEGAYVGAGAVVTKDVGPFAVVVGVPARRINTRRPVFHGQALRRL